LRTINNLKADIDSLKQELNVLSADAQDLRYDNQSINEIITNKSAEVASLKAELADLSDSNSHLTMERKDLEVQVNYQCYTVVLIMFRLVRTEVKIENMVLNSKKPITKSAKPLKRETNSRDLSVN